MTTLTPDEAYAAFRRAERLYLDDPAAAARELEPVRECEPESTAVLELYARALYASAQLGRAEAALRDLVEHRPDDAWAHVALARNLERQGRADEARTHHRVAEALGGVPD